MLIDSDEAIKRMQNVIEHYKKYGYMEEVMYRMAVEHCIAVIKEMAGDNNDACEETARSSECKKCSAYIKEIKKCVLSSTIKLAKYGKI